MPDLCRFLLEDMSYQGMFLLTTTRRGILTVDWHVDNLLTPCLSHMPYLGPFEVSGEKEICPKYIGRRGMTSAGKWRTTAKPWYENHMTTVGHLGAYSRTIDIGAVVCFPMK